MTILKFLTAATETGIFSPRQNSELRPVLTINIKPVCHLLAETAMLHIGIAIADLIAGQSKLENSPAYLRQSKFQAPTSLFHDYSFQARREKVSP